MTSIYLNLDEVDDEQQPLYQTEPYEPARAAWLLAYGLRWSRRIFALSAVIALLIGCVECIRLWNAWTPGWVETYPPAALGLGFAYVLLATAVVVVSDVLILAGAWRHVEAA